MIEAPVDLTRSTRRYVKEAVGFIRRSYDKPFFLYFAHHLPGSRKVPDVDPQFRGKSENGRYGDSVEEINWSVGQIMGELKNLGIDDGTLVIFTSDNGTPPDKGGSNVPWGGWAYTTSEGGMRMPCIVRWPGKVPAATTCDELCTMMDILPTIAALAGATIPQNTTIDGKNVWPLWSGAAGAKTPHEVFFYYMAEQLQAVRWKRWKLHLPLERMWRSSESRPMKLVDLDTDPGESKDLSADYPELVRNLTDLAEQARVELGDLGRPGSGRRPAGHVDRATPRLMSESG